MPTIVDIAHMFATAERALADGAAAICYPIVRDALAALDEQPRNRLMLQPDFDGLDWALRMRDGHETLYRLRRILARVPYAYGPEAGNAVAAVQAVE